MSDTRANDSSSILISSLIDSTPCHQYLTTYLPWVPSSSEDITNLNFGTMYRTSLRKLSSSSAPNIHEIWIYSISKPAFWFLLVSGPQKPIKTNKNQETRKLGNPGPISQKPHMSTYSKKPKKPTETLET